MTYAAAPINDEEDEDDLDVVDVVVLLLLLWWWLLVVGCWLFVVFVVVDDDDDDDERATHQRLRKASHDAQVGVPIGPRHLSSRFGQSTRKNRCISSSKSGSQSIYYINHQLRTDLDTVYDSI